jgi:hypothetical protein
MESTAGNACPVPGTRRRSAGRVQSRRSRPSGRKKELRYPPRVQTAPE